MPRDKKSIHRATSDVEDEEVSDTEIEEKQPVQSQGSDEVNKDLILERKKFLKEAILKRTLALRQQRERKSCQSK